MFLKQRGDTIDFAPIDESEMTSCNAPFTIIRTDLPVVDENQNIFEYSEEMEINENAEKGIMLVFVAWINLRF